MPAVGGHVRAYKAADEALQNDAVLNDDADLKFDVVAGEKWWFHFKGFLTTDDGNPDIKMALNGPAVNDLRFSLHIGEHTGTPGGYEEIKSAWEDTGTVNFTGAANDDFEMYGMVEPSADGTVVLRWAQQNSNAAFTTVKRGSSLLAVRMA